MKSPEPSFFSIKFDSVGEKMACGNNDGHISIFDIETCRKLKIIKRHFERVGILDWVNDQVFASGSRDHSIKLFDIR